jgi:anti-sigma B factor antagonist
MRPVTIEVQKSGSVCILDIKGEMRIGQPTVMLRQKCKELIEQGERLFVLDMLDVPWLDSSGLGEVFACFKRAREVDGVVKLVMRGKSYSLFTITQLDRVFEIFDDTGAAVGSFSS